MVLVFSVVGTQLSQKEDSTAIAQSDENNLILNEQQPSNDFEPKQTWSSETDLFKKPKKQSIDISAWLASHKGTYGISVYEEGDKLVDHRSIESFSMASIYKLYVAYIGYQKIDEGKWNESEIYLNDWTRGKCLDEMIRISHSPCGEKMLSELGDDEIMTEFSRYGFTDTNLTDFVTSSADVLKILLRLQNKQDLSEPSTKKILSSMEGQKYRDVLPKVFGDKWKVYDKVGFREQDEYHGVGIVSNSKDNSYIIVLLSSNAGTAKLAELSNAIKYDIGGL